MENKKSREAFFEFLDYIGQKGLIAPATASSRKASAGKVLGILDEHEAQDVTTINMDAVMNRFAHLQGKGYTPESLSTYKSRVKAALDDFCRYVENPLGFKPSVQSRERKPQIGKSTSSSTKASLEPDKPTTEVLHRTSTVSSGPMSSSIIPIPIRADLTIHIQGLPFDLTEAEAKKIAGVIHAMAMSS